MAKKATPYKEGSGWSLRRRVFGRDFYVSGQPTKGAAEKAMDKLLTPLSERGKPKGLGPRRTTLAQALQDMVCDRLPFMKGAAQEARRVNVYAWHPRLPQLFRPAAWLALQQPQLRGSDAGVSPATLFTVADFCTREWRHGVRAFRKLPQSADSRQTLAKFRDYWMTSSPLSVDELTWAYLRRGQIRRIFQLRALLSESRR